MALEVDYFEDTDFSEYSGNTDKLSRSSASAEGSYSCQIYKSSTGTPDVYSRPGDGLPNYPSETDIFNVWVYCASGTVSIRFGGESNDTYGNLTQCYDLDIDPYDNQFKIASVDSDGRLTALDSASVSLSTTTWYRCRVDYRASDTGTISVSLYENDSEIATVSTTDTSYTGSGIGINAADDGTDLDVHVDGWGVEEPPAAPSNLSASASTDDISLSWTDNSSKEDGFYVYRAQASGSTLSDYTRIADLGANTTSYTDSSLEDGETYYYRVTAYDAVGESDSSNEASATTSLPAPSGVSQAIDSPTTITVSFTDNSDNEDAYRVEKSTDGGTWTHVTDLGANTTSQQFSVSKS